MYSQGTIRTYYGRVSNVLRSKELFHIFVLKYTIAEYQVQRGTLVLF